MCLENVNFVAEESQSNVQNKMLQNKGTEESQSDAQNKRLQNKKLKFLKSWPQMLRTCPQNLSEIQG
jgi:hypothetical protein